MAKILDIPNSDYKIAVRPGGDIVLNTGVETGRVVISGSLVVEGDQVILGQGTNAQVSDLLIEDRIAQLNVGETGQGITGGVGVREESGLEIERGSEQNALMVYDEAAPFTALLGGVVQSSQGAFSLKYVDDNGNITGLAGLNTNSIDTNGYGHLYLDAGASSVKIPSIGYATRNLDADAVPTTGWVTGYVTSFTGANPPTSIVQSDTLVSAEDFDNTGVDSVVRIATDGFNRILVKNDATTIYDLTISSTTISTTTSGDDLNLIAAGGGTVRIADVLHIDADSTGGNISTPSSGTLIYSDATNGADTSVFYHASNGRSGEIASRRTAVLFGLIF